MESHFVLMMGQRLPYLYGYFDGSNDCNLVILLLGDSMGYTDGKVLGSNEGIKLVSTDGKVFGNIFGNLDGITIGIDVGTELGSLDGTSDSFNYEKLEILLLGDRKRSTYCKVLVSDDGIKLVSTEGKMLGTLLGNEDITTPGIDVGT